MRYVEHVEQYGTALFQRVCKLDLERIVAKHSFGNLTRQTSARPGCETQRKPKYTQMAGREKLFERERHREPVPGWHSCELACGVGIMNCQIEFVSSDSDNGMPCGKPAVAKCADSGICDSTY